MKVTAWNNGTYLSNGNGYGVKIHPLDRDRFFRRDWKTIHLVLEGESEPIEVNIDKDSFWNDTCRELISIKIGRWLIKNKLAPWTKGHPPILNLTQVAGNRFLLSCN